MNWWSKNRKTFVLVTTALLVLSAAAVISLRMISSRIGCTLVGCAGGIKVELAGLPDSVPFQISLTLPSGETQTLDCDPNALSGPSALGGTACHLNGGFFSLEQDFAPEEITVTVTVNGRQFSETFHPAYEKSQPNGAHCSPICYSALIHLNLSR